MTGSGTPWRATMSMRAQPSIPNDVVTTRFRPTKRRSVQATISSGVDVSAISAIAGTSCAGIRTAPPKPENEKARRTLPAGFTPMRVNVEPSGRPVGCGVRHTTTGHRAREGRGGEPMGCDRTHNHTVRLAVPGEVVNSAPLAGLVRPFHILLQPRVPPRRAAHHPTNL